MRRRSDATRVPPLPLPSSPRYILASFSLAARLLRVEMKIYVSAGCIRQFLPSPFFRTFTYSRGFIVGLDLYRKLNGEMKNRGKKLQVLNSEKCDEITRNVCTFRNIRVTAKGKRENIFFQFIYIYIFFFGRSRMTRRSHIRSFVSNVLTKFVKRQHDDFFFCIQKISFRNIVRSKDLSGILQYGSIQKSNWLTSFPVEFSIFAPKSNFDIHSQLIIMP